MDTTIGLGRTNFMMGLDSEELKAAVRAQKLKEAVPAQRSSWRGSEELKETLLPGSEELKDIAPRTQDVIIKGK